MTTPLHHRIGDAARSGPHRDPASLRPDDAHVVALHAMFETINRTMDDYAALLAERRAQTELMRDNNAALLADDDTPSRRTIARATDVSITISTLVAFVHRMRRGRARLQALGAPLGEVDVCTELVRVADKWLSFAEADAQRAAHQRNGHG